MKEGRIRESTRGGGRQRGRGGGPDAIKKAKREDKPIFLSIGYFACHWCQVMAHESFEDEDIAVLMNEHFVSIKVDREERPDIDEIYKQATMSMTQRGGLADVCLLERRRLTIFRWHILSPQQLRSASAPDCQSVAG